MDVLNWHFELWSWPRRILGKLIVLIAAMVGLGCACNLANAQDAPSPHTSASAALNAPELQPAQEIEDLRSQQGEPPVASDPLIGPVVAPSVLGWHTEALRFDNHKIVDVLEADTFFSVRLSAAVRRKIVLTSDRIREEVEKLRPDTSLIVQVVPIFSDGKLVPHAGVTNAIYPLKLQSRRHEAGDEASSAALGWIDIPFLVKKYASGCGTIALSFWNASMTEAWDSALIVLPIGDATGAVPNCAPQFGVQSGVVSGGTGMEVLAKTPSDSNESPSALNLHAFEISPNASPQSYVLFLAKGADGTQHTLGWRMELTLSGVFGGRRLQQLADQARSKLVEGDPAGYTRLATYMGGALFTATEPEDDATAKEALRILQDTAITQREASLSARFSVTGSDGSDLMYLPLRVLAWPAAGVMETDFDLVLALPKNEPVEACIARWHFLVPTSIADEADEDLRTFWTLMQELEPRWTGVVASNLEGYRGFLANSSADAGEPGQSDGLVLLAHSSPGDEGGLSLQGDDMISRVEIKRLFPPGSVALLAACSTAGKSDSSGLIKKLNEKNVATVAASPFTINTQYGVRLTYRFVSALRTAYEQGEPATFRDLIARAIDATNADYKASAESKQGLEFVLLGDPDIRLCTESQQGD